MDGLDRNAIKADMHAAPRQGFGGILDPRSTQSRLCALPLAGALLLTLSSGCGRAPTEDILPGGVPARTNLHQSTGLPAQSVRTVNRNDAGWRLIYHPAHAPAGAEQQAARALCGLERRAVAQIVRLPLDAPHDDPGAAKIDIICA
ncbi:MAG TPA: hypothetical protein VNQ78_04410 [Paracoccus sp. (in: a-proteobacteria)]|uniref:hypothetical protein n=1 Tax=Paracoccus sp. TaxID=267 RepID=UPI002CF7AD38|nr:hypothetical protein [Paracoccus sp. (in: a-proteobacteria)]HWL55902.1 hypothetical protein [Paracoccus sp. (in: a-proteobacteria)]